MAMRVNLRTVGGGRGEEAQEEPLSPAARLFMVPRFNCYIITVIGCKLGTTLSLPSFKEGLRLSMLKHPRFSSKVVVEDGKEMRWVPTKLDMESHVLVPDLDPKMKEPDRFVEDYISNLSTMPMDMSRPLWDIHTLMVRTSDAEATAVIRVHHSIGDGMSLASLILACCRKCSDPDALPSLPKAKPTFSRARRRSLISWLIVTTWTVWRYYWNTLLDIWLFSAMFFFLKDTKTPFKGGVGVERNPKRIVHRTVSLDDIKLVKNAMNVTINDVIVGVTEAGLSRYLDREYAKKNRGMEITQHKANNLPKRIRLTATIVVNIRPNTGIQALADMMSIKSKAKWGNQIGYIRFPFSMAMRKDPLDYIRRAKATIDKKKQSFEAICTFLINSFLTKLFGVKATAAIAYRIMSNTTLSFSNVAGPDEEITFHGHPLAYLAPSVCGHPQALTIHFMSYVDKMTISLTVDPSVIPNPHLLCDDLEESLKIIKDAAMESSHYFL